MKLKQRLLGCTVSPDLNKPASAGVSVAGPRPPRGVALYLSNLGKNQMLERLPQAARLLAEPRGAGAHDIFTNCI